MRTRSGCFVLIIILLGVLFCCQPVASAQDTKPCATWVAKVVSVQGSVQAKRIAEPEWLPVKLNDTYCPGDMIRVEGRSRAAIILPNEVLLRLDQNTTLTFNGIEKQGTSLIDLLKGTAHFFSRIPRGLKVTTPFVNGTVEGTEFLVRVAQDQTVITVFEGIVAAANQQGGISISPGQAAVAQAGQAPVLQVVVRPRDAVQWALYYPAIIDYRVEDFPQGAETGWASPVRKSIELYGEGDLANALSILDQAPEGIRDPRFFTYRAGLLLTVGRVDEAGADIEKALALDPSNSQAFALRSVFAVVQNEKDKALDLANKAVELDPHSATVRVARSYALQARFDLKGALAEIQEALKIAPQNALAWARLSELWLSLGYLDKALDAAKRAVALNPRLARTQVVLGFAYLDEINIKEAKGAFNKAIELDQANPLARLGLGLAKIRDGDLEGGREEIEIAAILDPNNSLIRSYLGKAYFDEKRDKLSGNQLETAKKLDPNDPTPWFYDAIRKQTINRPVEALQDQQKSIELNGNRAVYRSRLLLDSDLAARSATLGTIYNDLGFEQLALVEGWNSVNTDPGNYSAHRFLADTYAALPRHEVARVSELLQSQLLQPININPIQPLLAESKTYIYKGSGPSNPSFNEFNSLFNRNGLAFQISNFVGDNDTYGDEVIQSGVWGKASYSFGQFHYETNGFRKNNDQEQDIFDLFGQVSLSPETSIQTEVRYRDRTRGDSSIRFSPNDFVPNLRNDEELRSARFGFHHIFTPSSEVIGSFIAGREKYTVTDNPNYIIPFPPFGSALFEKVGIGLEQNGFIGEIQHLLRLNRFNLISGAGYFSAHVRDSVSTVFNVIEEPMVLQSSSSSPDKVRHANFYSYSYINYPEKFTWTIGASMDCFDDQTTIDRNQFNPKFGLTWNLFPSTTLRAAAFRVLERTLFFNQTIEPTQIAGFNQFFADGRATESGRWGVGIDQKFSPTVFGGLEFSRRDLSVTSTSLSTGGVTKTDWRELLGRAYLYWTPHQWLALSLEYQYEQYNWNAMFSPDNAVELHTYRVPLGINFFHPSGFSAMLKPTYVFQKGKLGNFYQGVVSDDSQFCVVDASISYRLPKRYGLISFDAKNLFDKKFKFQDTDPANPRIFPERFIFGKYTLTF